MDVFYIGYALDMAKDFIADCAEFAESYKLAAGRFRSLRKCGSRATSAKALPCSAALRIRLSH